MAEERPADVVGVIMRREGADDAHVVGFGDSDEVADVPRGVDDQAFAGVAVADEVHEVLHLCGHGVPGTEVATGQELTQVEA